MCLSENRDRIANSHYEGRRIFVPHVLLNVDMTMKTALMTVICLLVLITSACDNQVTFTPTPLPTTLPDLCSAAFLPIEVDKVHKIMREFDDASLLGTNTPRDQLPPIISDMQRIRREAEDHIVPPCLATLKSLQLAHLNTVISTLVAFLGGADQAVLTQGAELARLQHNEYALEYARLLGLTVIVPPAVTPEIQETVSPLSPTPIVQSALNPGPQDVNLYSEPSVDSTVVAVLFVNETARVVAQSPDGQWIQVEVPGQNAQLAWVQGASITISPAVP